MTGCAAITERGGKIAGSMGSVYESMAGSPEQDARTIAAYSVQFQRERGQWPASFQELRAFVKTQGDQLRPRRLENFQFKPKEDGRLVIFCEDAGAGFKDSTQSIGSPVPTQAVILITKEGSLRLEIEPVDLTPYE